MKAAMDAPPAEAAVAALAAALLALDISDTCLPGVAANLAALAAHARRLAEERPA